MVVPITATIETMDLVSSDIEGTNVSCSTCAHGTSTTNAVMTYENSATVVHFRTFT